MQIEAIYSQGYLEFVEPLRLKHDRIRLIVNVPDDEVENSDAVNFYVLPEALREQSQAMLAKMDEILNAPFSPDDELPDLTEKQLNNIEAFELRAQLRIEQGRPI